MSSSADSPGGRSRPLAVFRALEQQDTHAVAPPEPELTPAST